MADAKIKTILTANSSDFEAGIARATRALQDAEGKFKNSTKKMESSFLAVGRGAKALALAFVAREAAQAGGAIFALGDQLQTLSERTGVSVKFISSFQAEIENAGGSLEDFAGSINKMNVNLANAANDKSAAQKFQQIGLSVQDLLRMNPEDQFLTIATAISELGTQGEQAAAATDIFGKGVVSLLPTLTQGGDKLREMADEQERLGLIVNGNTAAKLDQIGDSVNTLSINLMNFSANKFVEWVGQVERAIGLYNQLDARGKAFFTNLDERLGLRAPAKPMQGPREEIDLTKPTPEAPSTKNYIRNLSGADSAAKKAAKSAQDFAAAIAQIKTESSRDLISSGLTPLGEKLKQIDDTVEDLAARYKMKLTPAQQAQIEAAKENVIALDALERRQKDAVELATDLGGAFSDAFEDGVLGAEKAGDAFAALGKQIQKIFFNQLVTQPLNDFFGEIARGFAKSGGSGGGSIWGGVGDIFSDIFGSLPSFAVGSWNVPRDMTANIHKGEMILTAKEAAAVRKGGGVGGDIQLTVINNNGSRISASRQKNGNGGTDLKIMVDKAVADNIARNGSATQSALEARDNQTLTRR